MDMVVVSHCGYNLHFPGDYWYWASFHELISHLYIFFCEVPLQILTSWKLRCILQLMAYYSLTVRERFFFLVGHKNMIHLMMDGIWNLWNTGSHLPWVIQWMRRGRMSNPDPVLLSSTVFSPVRRVRTKCVVSARKTKWVIHSTTMF